MIRYKTIATQAQAIDAILCNCCGNECPKPITVHEYAILEANWGYGSRKDGERDEAHICEDCYDKITNNFKIPPERSGYL